MQYVWDLGLCLTWDRIWECLSSSFLLLMLSFLYSIAASKASMASSNSIILQTSNRVLVTLFIIIDHEIFFHGGLWDSVNFIDLILPKLRCFALYSLFTHQYKHIHLITIMKLNMYYNHIYILFNSHVEVLQMKLDTHLRSSGADNSLPSWSFSSRTLRFFSSVSRLPCNRLSSSFTLCWSSTGVWVSSRLFSSIILSTVSSLVDTVKMFYKR